MRVDGVSVAGSAVIKVTVILQGVVGNISFTGIDIFDTFDDLFFFFSLL
ncbi:MAG: hypothetical protein QGH40_03340 [bacterium]|nr:hypothetical protein [bacterium]